VRFSGLSAERVIREPLLHFVLLGVLLFGLDAAFGHRASHARAPETDRNIVVSPSIRTQLANSWQQNHGKPATPGELEQEIRRYIDDEVLYREGLARGLDRDDGPVRARVASKMAFVLQSKLALDDPGDAVLRSWFDAHRGEVARPATVDFVHVFVREDDPSAKKRASELLDQLRAGAEPAGLGDRFSGGRHYRGRKLADLEESFGPEFAKGLFEQKPGEWQLRHSRFGWHLVEVVKTASAEDPTFASVRLDVLKSWRDARRSEELARATLSFAQLAGTVTPG